VTTTRTVTREYDAQGRLVRETEVTTTFPDVHYFPPTQWWQPVPVTYITCSSITPTDGSLRSFN
jgi:hypothetical protein